MIKKYPTKSYLLISVSFLLFAIASCKKDNKSNVTQQVVTATPTSFGLYESDSSIYKELNTAIAKIGTYNVDYPILFDTGSGGMVIDANSILPGSMITNSGFNFTGDSTVVGGITITSQKSIIEYGDDNATTDKVYGNLAYASVTVGDQATGSITIKRLPFFLYYKAVNGQGDQYGPHEFDTFGVSSEYDLSFANNVNIMSPLSYFVPGTGLTSGFKMAALGTSNFSYEGGYVSNAVILGLTADDLASSSGFSMTQLNYIAGDGYAPIIPSTITYSGKAVTTDIVFDTGTEPDSFIEDPTFPGSTTLLQPNTAVTVATTSGFNYSYTTSATDNLTYVENPNTSGGDVSVMSLEFFLTNSYLLNYADHKLGLKSN